MTAAAPPAPPGSSTSSRSRPLRKLRWPLPNSTSSAGPARASRCSCCIRWGEPSSSGTRCWTCWPADRDVIAIDMPGFGGSPSLPEGVEPTSGNLAASVLEFVGTLGLESKPGVAGISLGSWVSIECGRQGGVDSVVALCPAGFWREPLGPSRSRAYAVARATRPLVPLALRIPGLRHRALATNVHHPERVPLARRDRVGPRLRRGPGLPRVEPADAGEHHRGPLPTRGSADDRLGGVRPPGPQPAAARWRVARARATGRCCPAAATCPPGMTPSWCHG